MTEGINGSFDGDLISIIIPVYNVSDYLDKCVQSVLHQTYQHLEVILVDDGSTDDSGLKCEEFAKSDSRIVVIHQENGGLSAARNSGLDICQGEYIGFVDSDDFIAETMYEELYEAVLKTGADMSVCGRVFVDFQGRETEIIPDHTEVLNRDDYIERVFHDPGVNVTAWNRLYSKKLFGSVRYPVGHVFEDGFTVMDIAYQCEKVAVVPKALYYYISREDSITAKRKLWKYLDAVKSVEEMEKSVIQNDKKHMPFVLERYAVCRLDWWRACARIRDKDEEIDEIMRLCRKYLKKHFNDFTNTGVMKKNKLWAQLIAYTPGLAEARIRRA